MIITVELLKQLNACQSQVDLFVELFGNSVEINQTNFDIAVNNGMDIGGL